MEQCYHVCCQNIATSGATSKQPYGKSDKALRTVCRIIFNLFVEYED